MIWEMVDVRVSAERADEFEQSVVAMSYLLTEAAGCHGFEMHKSLDRTGWYRFVVLWESVEAHVTEFRGSPAFVKWKARVGCFYEKIENADHFECFHGAK